jgi:hypothetical protein
MIRLEHVPAQEAVDSPGNWTTAADQERAAKGAVWCVCALRGIQVYQGLRDIYVVDLTGDGSAWYRIQRT